VTEVPSDALPSRLDSDWLRERFARLVSVPPIALGDGIRWAESTALRVPSDLRPAGVLIPVVDRPDGLTVLFTRRTDHLHAHAGQISFPGGGAEEGDATIVDTALRETREEIGLEPRHVEVIGSLHEYRTVSGYRVTPVVALVHPPFALAPDDFEVAEIFEVPLAHLLDARNHRRERLIREGGAREYYSVPYRHYYIWGATAGMLMNLHAHLVCR